MNLGFIILIIVGLSLFEIITSVDNAIINAEVLSGMGNKSRKWFLLWGFLFAVIVVRGLLPLIIVWAANPGIGISGAFLATLSGNKEIAKSIENSSPLLLVGGGTFLVFLFFNWLFLEPKSFGLKGERFFHMQGAWYFTAAIIFISLTIRLALKIDPVMVLGIILGLVIFFIVYGFKRYAEQQERKLLKGGMSDISKIIYLEILDATFSIDGVVGAFAFTFSVPLIILGNGLGAYILRRLTVGNIERIKKYKYLKNGAMYSVLFLGLIMILDSFGFFIPAWFSPVVTFVIVGYFFLKSQKELL
jgi:uncharacterized protein